MFERITRHTPKAVSLLAGALILALAFSAGNVLADDPGQGRERPGASKGPGTGGTDKTKPRSGPTTLAANQFAGTLNATGGACFGDAQCSAAYNAAPGDIEAIHLAGNPRIFLANMPNAGTPSIQWVLAHSPSAGGFAIWDRFLARPFIIEQGAPENALFVDSTGNVGMGTGAPGTLLHLNDAVASLRLRIQSDDDRTDLWQGGTGLWFQNVLNGGAATNSVKFQNGAPNDSLVVDDNGFVGLGTAAPSTIAHMRRTVGDTSMRMERVGGAVLDFTAGPGAAAFGTITNFPIVVVTNGGERMRLTNTAVGIFQPAPAHMIHLGGGAFSDGAVWTNASSLNLKRDFEAVDAREVLEKIADLPVQTWTYNTEDASVRHMGPTAEDFFAAFGLGGDDKSIGTVDADGVALAAVQGLYQVVKEKDALIARQQDQLSEQQTQLKSLEARLAALENGGATASSPSASQAAAGDSNAAWLALGLIGAGVFAGLAAYGLKRRLAA